MAGEKKSEASQSSTLPNRIRSFRRAQSLSPQKAALLVPTEKSSVSSSPSVISHAVKLIPARCMAEKGLDVLLARNNEKQALMAQENRKDRSLSDSFPQKLLVGESTHGR